MPPPGTGGKANSSCVIPTFVNQAYYQNTHLSVLREMLLIFLLVFKASITRITIMSKNGFFSLLLLLQTEKVIVSDDYGDIHFEHKQASKELF